MMSSSFRPLLIATVIALVSFSGAFLTFFLPAAHGLDITGHPIGRDFINMWVGAHAIAENNIALLFDRSGYNVFLDQLWGTDLPVHYWSYPPLIFPFVTPFAAMPYFAALLLWTGLGIALMCWVLRQAAPQASLSWYLLLIFAPASIVNLLSGQNGFISAGLFVGGLALTKTRPILAGILFGLLTFKPHLGLLIPLVLLIEKQWRTIAAAAITSLALAGLSIALYGTAPWHDFLTITRDYQLFLLESFKGFYAAMMPGLFASFRLIGLNYETAMTLHVLLALPFAAAALWIVRREDLSARAILAITLAAFVITPYGFNYDMTGITLALVIYAISTPQHRTWEWIALSLLWIVATSTYILNTAYIPPWPIIYATSMTILLHASHQKR